MKVITIQTRMATVAERFHATYRTPLGPHGSLSEKQQAAYEQLKAASLPEHVFAVLSKSWILIQCDNCEREVSVAVELGSHSMDEYGPCAYCLDCLTQATQLAAEAASREPTPKPCRGCKHLGSWPDVPQSLCTKAKRATKDCTVDPDSPHPDWCPGREEITP